VHVFHRDPQTLEWESLAAARLQWTELLAVITSSPAKHAVVIEFVRGDRFSSLRKDAATLFRCAPFETIAG
jgi:hypothetical protein